MPDETSVNQGLARAPTVAAEASWHLTETITALRAEPVPLNAELLVVVLRGLAELCRLVQARGPEAGAEPPVLFRDNPVIAEALGMWATEAARLAHERTAGAEGSRR